MRLLFLAFAISFCALLWVAVSVTRHILRHKPQGAGNPDAPVDGAQLTTMEPAADPAGARSRPRP